MAITTLGLTGFEHGYIGAGAQNGGGLFDLAPGSGWQVTTTAVRNGTYAARLIAPANTATRLVNNVTGAPTKVVERFAVKVTARPSSGLVVLAYGSDGVQNVYLVTVSSAGVLSVQLILGGSAGTAQTGPTIDTTNWHLIELQIDFTAKTLDWKVDGVLQTRATSTGTAQPLTSIGLGTPATNQPAFNADFDDVIIGTWTVAGTDWYGDGKVLRQLAGSDGTHATITSLSPGDAATAYSGTVTTAYTMVDDVPGGGAWTNSRTTTDNLALRTATVGAYAEIKPATTAEAGLANAVKAILSYSSSATQANLAACDVRNSAGAIKELWGLTGGVGQDYSETTNFFKSAIVTVPAAGWTAAEVNAIRFRFGGCTSADISPVPTVQGLMLEVDWPIEVIAPPLYETSIDTFDRADGLIDAGGPWVLTPIAGGAAQDLRVISNTLGRLTAATHEGYTTTPIDNSGGNCDVLIDMPVTTGASSFNLYFLVTSPGTATWSGYRFAYTGGIGTAALTRWANGSNVETLASGGTGGFAGGSALWFRKRGSRIDLIRITSGVYTALLSATDSDHNPASGVVGIQLTDQFTRWDNLRGGPLVVPTTTPVARVSLASGNTPTTRTAHSIKVRARKASGSGTVLLSAALYEGSTNRSGNLVTSALTTSFADYTLAIPDASAANITSYSDLELRFWANSATGDAVNVEVARIALVAPAGAAGPQTLFGSSSLTTTFGSTTAAQRRTTSAVAAPTTFGAVVQARRKTFGQVAAPFTVGVATQGASAYPDVILGTPGLVSYWRLNEAAGNVLDSKGTNHGTVVGAGITRSVPGLLSRGGDTAMQGSAGTTSYVTIPTSASLDVTSQATVELWVRPSAIVAAAHVINRGTDNAFYIRHYAAGDGRWEFNFYDANAVRRTSAAGLPIAEVGKRQHLVMTYDAAGVMRTYIDGVQVGTPVSCNANIRTGGSLVIFDRFQGAGTGFAGVVDEVALYNVVLTPQQVASHFAIGAPPVTLYGATATSVGFGAVTQGLRKAKGVTAAPFTFGAVTQAQRRTTSALVAPFSFGAVTQAKRRTTGVVDRASTFGAVTQGQRKALGVVARASTFGAVTQAGRKTFSSTAAPSTFAAVTQARRRTTSAVVAPFAFGSTTAGVASTPAPPGAYFDEVLADDPIGYWRLGEPSGTVAVDQMGLHDGTYTGAPVLGTPGLLTNDSNAAIEIAGQPTQGVQLPNHADYQIGTLTLEAWVKTSHTDSSWRSIAVKQHAYSIFNYSGNLAAYIWGTATVISTGVPLHDGIRHHVVLVCQEGVAGGSQFYCDGVPVGAPFTYVTSNHTEGLSFGYNPASGQELFGVIDEVAIYGYTLTPAQIARHHQAGLTGVPGTTYYGSSSLAVSVRRDDRQVSVRSSGRSPGRPRWPPSRRASARRSGSLRAPARSVPSRPRSAARSARSRGPRASGPRLSPSAARRAWSPRRRASAPSPRAAAGRRPR